MRMLPLLLLLLAPLSAWSAITDQPPRTGAADTYEKLQTACTTLLQEGPQGNIAALSPFYAATTNAEIREAIAAANGLYWMMCQRIAEADRDAEYLRKNFPDSRYQFLLDKEANLVACTNCHDGVALLPCPDCGGTGKCRACGGRGKIAGIANGFTTFGFGIGSGNTNFAKAVATGAGPVRTLGGNDTRTLTTRPMDEPAALQPCPLCGGSGLCKTCNGAKVVKGRCPFCHGFGTVFTPRTRLAYADVLGRLRNLAVAAAMAERGMVRLDSRWTDRNTRDQTLQRRQEDHADFVRATVEAERARDYDTAFQLLDRALARHPDSIYTDDVRRMQSLLRADAANRKLPEKSVRGMEQTAAVNNNPSREIGIIVEAVLTACRRGTNTPLLIATQASPVLPANPVNWRIGEPELLDRTARVRVTIDRPGRSGLLNAEPWEFRLVYENIQWKVWQTAGP
jgi:hypothetical protein